LKAGNIAGGPLLDFPWRFSAFTSLYILLSPAFDAVVDVQQCLGEISDHIQIFAVAASFSSIDSSATPTSQPVDHARDERS